jgi:hypothetical protein
VYQLQCWHLCQQHDSEPSRRLSTPACAGNCSAGYACPAGSTSSSAVMCVAGQYSSSGAGSCTQCPSPTPFSSPTWRDVSR